MRIFAENLLNSFLNGRHAGHTADQNDFVNIAGAKPGVFQRLATWTFHAIDQIGAQRLELRSRQLHVQMFWPLLVRGYKRQIYIGFNRRRKLAFRLFSRFF